MKVSLAWLKELVDLPALSREELASRLTLTGTKVEGIKSISDINSELLIGRIDKIEKHPEADRLVVCQVDVGDKKLQIVTGAPNVVEDALVIVATDGAKLGNGLEIVTSELRGVKSEGMLCSLDELGYSHNVLPKGASDGILLLDQGKPGDSFFQVYGLKDGSMELEITYNRPDCLSMMGIAQEVAATFNLDYPGPLSIDPSTLPQGSLPIERKEGCYAYYALEMKDVVIEESPLAWQFILMDMGMRPISNVVDATNLAMLYSGNPIHAFDARAVEGGIIVDACHEEREFATLDGTQRKLKEGDLQIKDHEKIIGIAGIMGGKNSQIMDDTKDLLVEFASFHPSSIAKTARRLGLRSEASSRFEKKIEPERTKLAMAIFLELMKGKYSSLTCSGDAETTERLPVYLRRTRAEELLGVALSLEELEEIFRKLELKTEREEDGLYVTPSLSRSDLLLEADLIEEVARIYGFDKIPSSLPSIPKPAKLTDEQTFEWKVRDLLWGMGLEEMLNYSFVSPRSAADIQMDTEHPLVLLNPLGEEFSQMRHSLLISALDVLKRNENMKNEKVNFFEIGNVFEKKEDITQSKHLSLASFGEGDFFSLKGKIEELLQAIGIKAEYRVSENKAYHSGRSADVYYKGELLGSFGELSPYISRDRDFRHRIYLAEFSMDKLFSLKDETVVHDAPSRYPEVVRDLALLVDKNLSHDEIYAKIEASGGELLSGVELFDLYYGDELGQDKKSIAYHIYFQSKERTLTDDEVEAVMASILKAVEELGAQRR